MFSLAFLGVTSLAFAANDARNLQDAGVHWSHIEVLANVAAPETTSAERVTRRFAATREGDVDELLALAQGSDAAAYLAARDVLRLTDDDATRLEALLRIDALRIREPLARASQRRFDLELGRTARRLGQWNVASEAFIRALPESEAADALESLVADPFERARIFLDARMEQRALAALRDAGVSAPSIEAPALRRLGRHDEALDAYQRWLDAQPDATAATEGLAWSHWFLGDLNAAEAAFAELPESDGAYGLGLIANRRGDLDATERLLLASNSASHWWLLTSILERNDAPRRALDVYLQLARGGSSYADDAAYRAMVLASSLNEGAAERTARSLVPADSFFATKDQMGQTLELQDTLTQGEPDAVQTAHWLASFGDLEAARTVLLFALRDAENEDEIVAIGEALNAYGEYRQPQRVASQLIEQGSKERRTWRLAYPAAWPELVVSAARNEGVEPALAWSVMRRESAFFPEAVSRSGAQGLMQIMPATWDWLAEIQNQQDASNAFDIAMNVRFGVHYLGYLGRYFDGDDELAIASYNRGQGYIGRLFESPDVAANKDELYRWIDALETREYMQNVWVTRNIYRALWPEHNTE
jgi:soluble lytic murein transglycosylase